MLEGPGRCLAGNPQGIADQRAGMSIASLAGRPDIGRAAAPFAQSDDGGAPGAGSPETISTTPQRQGFFPVTDHGQGEVSSPGDAEIAFEAFRRSPSILTSADAVIEGKRNSR